jgi:hypothetical protein
MTSAELIPIALQLSIALLVFALARRVGDVISGFRQPRLLLRSILAMAILLMIAFVVATASVFEHRRARRIAGAAHIRFRQVAVIALLAAGRDQPVRRILSAIWAATSDEDLELCTSS